MGDKDRLDSWKEIATYLNRDLKTCLRWEKDLCLPVFRVNHKSTRSRVFSYKSEIDHWFNKKKQKTNEETD